MLCLLFLTSLSHIVLGAVGGIINQVATSDDFSARNVHRNKDQHRYCAKWAMEGQCITNHK